MAKSSYYYLSPENRTQVSLRVPYEIAAEIEGYAASRNLRKTDAYVHFLAKGLEAESADAASSVDAKLDKIITLLEGLR